MRPTLFLNGLVIALFVLFGFGPLPGAHAVGLDDFVTTWDTSNPGTSGASSITIPILGSGYAYQVDWNGDGDFDDLDEATIHSSAVTHDFLVPGVYQIRISGDFPQINFNGAGDAQKLVSIDQWGSQVWATMENAFFGCSNLTITASDAPDLTTATSLANMFRGVPSTPNLSAWNTSNITNMRSVFRASAANPDVSNWDMTSVNDMDSMFRDTSNANPDVSNWDTSNVVNVYGLFDDAVAANPQTTNWDTANMTAMGYMFRGATVANPDVSGWDTSSVLDMQSLFRDVPGADPDVSNWDTSSVTSMYSMFRGATVANPDVSGWDTANVTTIQSMFFGAESADPQVSAWNTANVTTMQSTFRGASLANPDVFGWDTSSVTSMYSTFYDAVAADPDVSAWDTSDVEFMNYMFRGAPLADPDVSGWDTSSVTSMTNMFRDATSADPDVSGWDTGLVTEMESMFRGATSADPDVSGWDTSNVTTIEGMFLDSLAFDRALDTWNLTSVANLTNFMRGASISSENYDATLQSWAAQSLQPNLDVDFGTSHYCESVAERVAIEGTFGWTITDGGLACAPDTPTVAADLPADWDSGSSATDNLTAVADLLLTIPCSAVGRTIRVFADLPTPSTELTAAVCPDSLEVEVSLSGLADGSYELTYTESDGPAESDHSPPLEVRIDSTAPVAPACTASPELAGIGTSVSLVCAGVEVGATLVVPNMVCSGAPSAEAGQVVCEGTVGSNVAEPTGLVVASNGIVVMTDPAGNKVEFPNGVVVDLSPPVAVLLGPESMSLPIGGTLVDPGATCTDQDNGICAIERSAVTLDLSTAGTYSVSYVAVDGAGNRSSVITREVVVYVPVIAQKVGNTVGRRSTDLPLDEHRIDSPKPAPAESLPKEIAESPTTTLAPPVEQSSPGGDPLDLVADAAFVDGSQRSTQRFGGLRLFGALLVFMVVAWFAIAGRRRRNEEDSPAAGS